MDQLFLLSVRRKPKKKQTDDSFVRLKISENLVLSFHEKKKSTQENEPMSRDVDTKLAKVTFKHKSKDELKHSSDVLNYLLDAYRKNEKFWNPEDLLNNADRKMFHDLSESLLADMNYKLSSSEIYTIIKGLRSKYHRELAKIKKHNGKYKPKFKYFSEMDFLANIIENKRTDRKYNKKLSTVVTKSTVQLTKLAKNRDELIYLLNIFKSWECLWNPQDSDYLKCNETEIFNSISSQLHDDIDSVLTGEECAAEIQKLQIKYRHELAIWIKHKGLYVPKLWCFEKMEFLKCIFENEIKKRLNQNKGAISSRPKSAYLRTKPILFEDNREQLKLIEIYRSYSALWDVDHPDYRSATYRKEEMNKMLQDVNLSLNINCNLGQLQKTLFQLRKDFSTEKEQLFAEKATAKVPSLIYMKLKEFLESNLGPFRCDFCNELIRTSDQYKVHRSGHDGTQPFICTLCGKGFQMPGNLAIHIRRHKRDLPYACGVCDKRFATSTEVAIHMRSHTGERPYICDLCGKSFKTWSFFDIHRRTHLKQSNFHCPICDKDFYEKNRYTDHMNYHLNIRKHSCKVCDKSFTTLANLRKHNELHLSVKKYKCDDCDKCFAQQASLRWHSRTTHTPVEQVEP